jgi:hypothetical protein
VDFHTIGRNAFKSEIIGLVEREVPIQMVFSLQEDHGDTGGVVRRQSSIVLHGVAGGIAIRTWGTVAIGFDVVGVG